MRRRRRAGAAGVLTVMALTASACGYSFRGALPPHIETVAVPVFANRTSEPAVESIITRAIVDAFASSGRLRVTTPDRADAVLEGEITGYELVSVAFDPSSNVRVYRLVVTVNVTFRDLRRNTVLFHREGMRERADFRVPGTVTETLVREQAALRTAAVDIGRSVVSAALDRF